MGQGQGPGLRLSSLPAALLRLIDRQADDTVLRSHGRKPAGAGVTLPPLNLPKGVGAAGLGKGSAADPRAEGRGQRNSRRGQN